MLYKGIELTDDDMFEIYLTYRIKREKEFILDNYDVTEEQAEKMAIEVIDLKDDSLEWCIVDFYTEAAIACGIKELCWR